MKVKPWLVYFAIFVAGFMCCFCLFVLIAKYYPAPAAKKVPMAMCTLT